MLRKFSGSRPRPRGAALIITVLICAIAASIAAVIITQSLYATRDESASMDVSTAKEQLADMQSSFEEELLKDPDFFLTKVWYYEETRVCTTSGATTASSPTALTDFNCASAWTYQKPSAPSNNASFAQVSPPSKDSSVLGLRLSTVYGTASVGLNLTYNISDAGRFTLYSSAATDLDPNMAFTTSNSCPSSLPLSLSLSGSVYSNANVQLPCGGTPQTFQEGQILSETAINGSFPNSLLYYAQNASSTPLIKPVRNVVASPLNASGLSTSTSDAITLACARAEGCLRHNGNPLSLKNAAGTNVAIPDANAYLVLPGANNTFTLSVRTSNYTPGKSLASSLCAASPCSIMGLSAAETTANTHPGRLGYWTSLGSFPLPSSGVLATDADTYVGICDTFATAPCAVNTFGSRLSIIAGAPDAPRDLYVSGSVSGPALGLVSSGKTFLPYWSHAAGGDLSVDAAVVALNVSPTQDPTFASGVSSLPNANDRAAALGTPASTPSNWGGTLYVASVASPNVQVADMGLYSKVAFTGSQKFYVNPPPFLPSFSASWSLSAKKQMNVSDLASMYS